MVNRQDVPRSPGSPAIGQPPLAAKINFDGTKLPMVVQAYWATANGRNRPFLLK
jgi:hypothetical protein